MPPDLLDLITWMQNPTYCDRYAIISFFCFHFYYAIIIIFFYVHFFEGMIVVRSCYIIQLSCHQRNRFYSSRLVRTGRHSSIQQCMTSLTRLSRKWWTVINGGIGSRKTTHSTPMYAILRERRRMNASWHLLLILRWKPTYCDVAGIWQFISTTIHPTKCCLNCISNGWSIMSLAENYVPYNYKCILMNVCNHSYWIVDM